MYIALFVSLLSIFVKEYVNKSVFIYKIYIFPTHSYLTIVAFMRYRKYFAFKDATPVSVDQNC